MDRTARRVRRRSIILLTLFLIALFTGMARPRPARAENLGLIIGIGVGVFAVVVIAGTWLVYGRKYEPKQAFLPEPPASPGSQADAGGLRLASRCPPAEDGQAPLVCW